MNHDRKAELVRQRNSVRLAFGASVSLVAGSLAIVAGTMAPAHAADGQIKINLVGVNDFHGRIDANTVKWAGTVKKLELDTPGTSPDAALVVGAVLATVAYVLVQQGKERVADAGAPVPEQTIETMKEDVEWAKTRASSARK